MSEKIEDQITLLETKLSTLKIASERAEVLNDLATCLRFISAERSENYAREALLLADQLKDDLQKSRALRLIACAEDIANNHKDALQHILEAKTLAQSLGSIHEVIICNNLLGKILMYLNDLPAALTIYSENTALSKETGDPIRQADALLTEAVVHFRNNDFETCRPLLEKSLELARKIEYRDGIGRALLNLSATLLETGHFEEGLSVSAEAIPFFKQNKNLVDLAHSLSNNGTACVALGRYADGEKRFLEVRAIRSEINDVLHLPNSYISTAEIYILTGRFEEALRDLTRASDLAKDLTQRLVHAHITEMFFRLYEKSGDFKKALEAHKELFNITKKIAKEERNRDLGNLRLRFEFDKIQEEKELYRLHSIEVEEANKKISQQKELIEEKNRDITDSIQYARRIQEALLPHDAEFRRLFPESFVLYKPKDIISGDFYWCKETKDTLILAVADCTGHGVPGALMSMIGHNLLNQSFDGGNCSSPSALLESLDEGLRNILKQETNEDGGNDGMDIAICFINRKSNKLIFSGARRPIWLLRKGEVLETKPDRHPVGGKRNEARHFTNKEIQLKPNDMIYLFTDGYADQFGGAQGRKFQSMRMKEMLVDLCNKNPLEQKEQIEFEWETWRGKLEQVDDVLLIGVVIENTSSL